LPYGLSYGLFEFESEHRASCLDFSIARKGRQGTRLRNTEERETGTEILMCWKEALLKSSKEHKIKHEVGRKEKKFVFDCGFWRVCKGVLVGREAARRAAARAHATRQR
jgi:hypothetical protein